MENKFAYQKEESNKELLGEMESVFKEKSIEGSGSNLKTLKSIDSQPKELEHSSQSSLHPLALSNNSMSNSNENKIINSKENDKSNSFHSNDKVNYPKFEDLKIDIKKFEKKLNETDAFILTYVMEDNDDSKIYTDIKKDILEAKSDKANNNNFGNISNLIKVTYDKKNINKKDNNNNIENDDIEKIKKGVLIKIKEGYFPFFIRAKEFSPIFYYGKPKSPIKLYIEHYLKVNNMPKDKYLFFYNGIIINLDNNLKDLNMKILGVIEAIENNNLI